MLEIDFEDQNEEKGKNVWLEMDTFDRIIFTNLTALLNGDVQYLLAYL